MATTAASIRFFFFFLALTSSFSLLLFYFQLTGKHQAGRGVAQDHRSRPWLRHSTAQGKEKNKREDDECVVFFLHSIGRQRSRLSRPPPPTSLPPFSLLSLQFISTDAPVELRQAAAVAFKNLVKFKWEPAVLADDGENNSNNDATANGNGVSSSTSTSTSATAAISLEVKHQVKASIVALMLSAPPAVRAQLSEALAVIGKYDYPSRWPELLPDLVARLRSANSPSAASASAPSQTSSPSLAATHGVLATANAICKRYRGAFMTDSLSAELEYSQKLAGPLLESLRCSLEQARAFTRAARAARGPSPFSALFSPEDAAAAARAADGALDSARLACRVFLSLNSPGLTEVFEEALPGWMESLLAALTVDDPGEVESEGGGSQQSQQVADAGEAQAAVAAAVAAASGPGAVSLPPRGGSGSSESSAADALRAAVCDAINLFVEVNEEEFAPYLPRFAAAVWALLVKVSSSSPAPSPASSSYASDSKSDAVAIAAMRFLTTVARGVHAGLFVADSSASGGAAAAGAAGTTAASSSPPSDDPAEPSPTGALAQVCDAVVLPALVLRSDGTELFESNWVEYVRRDAEGADADTRRRAAAELARALVERFPRGAGVLFSRAAQRLLEEARVGGPAAWRSKDAALYLVMALMAKKSERAPGVSVAAAAASASSASAPPVVDIPSFFAAHVAPELASRAAGPPDSASTGSDVLAADALRFLSTFRQLLRPSDLAAATPALVALLRVEAAVVHSYAAIALERLLAPQRTLQAAAAAAPGTTRGAPSAVVSAPLVPRDVLRPQLQPLLSALFAAFELPDSSENEYLMRCVARTLAAAGPDVGPFAPHALSELARMSLEAAANPSHPLFNHYLFESVAVLVRAAAAAGEPALAAVEAALFPAITAVLQNDVQEFHPYVFQVLAQLAEARPLAPGVVGGEAAAATATTAAATTATATTLPPAYLQLLRPLLAPAFWERGANVPALARLLRALLLRAGSSVVREAQLEPVLGVVQKLISSRGAADAESGRTALALLRGVSAASPSPSGGGGGAAALDPYLPTLWGLLFARAQAARTPRFVRGLLLFASGFAVVKSSRPSGNGGGGAAALAASVDAVQPGLFAGGLLRHLWTPALASLSVSGAPEDERKLACVATGMVLAECEGVRATTDLAAALLSAAVAAAGGGGSGATAAHPSASSANLLLEDALEDAAGGLTGGGGSHGGAGGHGGGGYSAAYAALIYAAPRPDDLLPLCPSAAAGLAEQLSRAVSPACGGAAWLAAAIGAAQNSEQLGARVRELLAGVGVAL